MQRYNIFIFAPRKQQISYFHKPCEILHRDLKESTFRLLCYLVEDFVKLSEGSRNRLLIPPQNVELTQSMI